jgi:hypothetical protein
MNDTNNNLNDSDYDFWGRRKHRSAQGGMFSGHSNPQHHIVLGIIVLGLGVLFLLQNLGIFFIRDIGQFWPVIIIGVGISHLLQSFNLHGKLWGTMIAGVGVIFLASNLGYLPWNAWQMLWPFVLICAGVGMLLRGLDNNPPGNKPGFFHDNGPTISDNIFKHDVIFGGVNRKIQAQDFQGGSASAVFGGIEIDLRGSATTRDEIYIEANAVFGGVELKVPDTWDVLVRGTAMFGGYEDKTHPAPAISGAKRPRLIIRGSAVFGGVNIRN